MKAHELNAFGMNELTIEEQMDLSGGAPGIPTVPVWMWYLIELIFGDEEEPIDGGELPPAVCEG